MAWDYNSDETPDYSQNHDFSEDTSDYSNMSDAELGEHARNYPDQDALHRDLMDGGYQRKSFGENFKDKYKETKSALDKAEKGEGHSNKSGGRDIGKQERSTKEPAWKTNLEAKRSAAIAASQNKQSGFLSRHKKGAVGWLIGIVMAGSMSIFMLPSIAVAEFGQIANWIKNTTQTVHELTTGARSMRNVVKSATVAVRSAAGSSARMHFQTSRVGMFGEMTGRNYLTKLENAGVKIHESGVLGTWEGIEIDVEKTSGKKGFSNMSPEMKAKYVQSKYPELDMSKVKFDGGKIQFEGKMSYRDTLKTLRAVNRATGASKFKLGTEIKIRYTARMLGINSWLHPIEKLKGLSRDEIQKKLKAAKEKKSGKAERLSTDEKSRRSNTETDSNGNETETQTSKDGATELNEIEEGATKPKKEGRIAKFTGNPKVQKIGKGAGIAGIIVLGLCSIYAAQKAFLENMYSLTTSMSSIYQSQVATWGQIQSAFLGLDNEAIDMNVLAELHTDLYEENIPVDYEVDEDGYIIEDTVTKTTDRSWTGSAAYQATINGEVISQERTPTQVATMYEEDGGWAAQVAGILDVIPLLKEIVGAACTEAGQWILTVLGGLASPVATIVSTVIMEIPAVQELMGQLIAFVFQIGSGIMLDDSQLDPDQRAEVAYRASEYIMNTNSANMGAGNVKDTAAEYKNQLIAQEWLNAEWQARPLADRLFDATDYRSTVAQVVNGAGINTVPDNIGGHFANFAKLIGAVPNFIAGGLFGGKSAQAMAASAVAYETGAPKYEFDEDFMDKITGGDESWDYDENSEIVFGLLGDTGTSTDYHQYAKDCLGLEISSGPEYKVTSIESEDPKEALLVGIQGAAYEKKGCAEKTDDDSDSDNNYRRVALYAGLDYSIMAGYAWYGTDSDDPDAKTVAKELGFDDGGDTGGDPTGQFSFPGNPSEFAVTAWFGDVTCHDHSHGGTDFATLGSTYGNDVKAADGGEVTTAGDGGGFGNLVVIDHGGGLETYYGHNQSIVVARGDKVSRGDIIAKVGSTGNSTGPHIHFEVRENGVAVDPAKYLKTPSEVKDLAGNCRP